jgi:predicted nuclease of predicted toxin-antitoxin system
MKFLLDENIPKGIYTEMLRRGYDVVHILFLKRGMTDKEIVDIANREEMVIVTQDEDFIQLSMFIETGVILIRRRFRRAEIPELVDAIEKTIALKGKIAILRDNYVEIVE